MGVSALLCSWDVKRAFDSVSKTVIRMALNRLGVPANLINMIHAMEVEGITIVQTPLTQYIYLTRRAWKAYDVWMPSSLGY